MASTFEQVAAAHRARLGRLMNGAERDLSDLYDEAAGEMTRKIRTAVVRLGGDSFTVHHHRVAMAQIREGQKILSARLADRLGEHSEQAQVESIRSLSADVSRLQRRYVGSEVALPIEEAATFQGLIHRRRSSLLKMHRESMARYGAETVQKMERQLSLGLLEEETPGEVSDRLDGFVDRQRYRAIRIARTETAYAYNAGHRDGIARAAKELDTLMSQWHEHADEQGRYLDDRVAVDSLAMHLQVAAPGEVFTQPARSPTPDADGETIVPESLAGDSWEFPPNRPNDRSVLIPWMKAWGQPGWRWRGRRVQM